MKLVLQEKVVNSYQDEYGIQYEETVPVEIEIVEGVTLNGAPVDGCDFDSRGNLIP